MTRRYVSRGDGFCVFQVGCDSQMCLLRGWVLCVPGKSVTSRCVCGGDGFCAFQVGCDS